MALEYVIMPIRQFVAIFLFAGILAQGVVAHAQGTSTFTSASRPVGAIGSRLSGKAVRTTEAPKIDGILDDRVWQQATPMTNFIQSEPAEGEPSSERTEVRILYDAKN